MRMQLSRPGRNVELRELPGEGIPPDPSAESIWRIAFLWGTTPEGLGMRTSWAPWDTGDGMRLQERLMPAARAGTENAALRASDSDYEDDDALRTTTCTAHSSWARATHERVEWPQSPGHSERWVLDHLPSDHEAPPSLGLSRIKQSERVTASALPALGKHIEAAAGGLNALPMLITGTTGKAFRWAFYGWDHLDSIRLQTSESGSLMSQATYGPYGSLINSVTGETSIYRKSFTGHEITSGTDLIYMRGRYYTPELGRFLSKDPITHLVSGSASMNGYAYVGDNPVNLVDPDGKAPQDHHNTLAHDYGMTGGFPAAVEDVDNGLSAAKAGNFAPHFGGMAQAWDYLQRAAEAHLSQDRAGVRKYMSLAVHAAHDAAYHVNANGELISPLAHLLRKLFGWLPGVPDNPDKISDVKDQNAQRNVAYLDAVWMLMFGIDMNTAFNQEQEENNDSEDTDQDSKKSSSVLEDGSNWLSDGHYLNSRAAAHEAAMMDRAFDSWRGGPRTPPLRR